MGKLVETVLVGAFPREKGSSQNLAWAGSLISSSVRTKTRSSWPAAVLGFRVSQINAWCWICTRQRCRGMLGKTSVRDLSRGDDRRKRLGVADTPGP